MLLLSVLLALSLKPQVAAAEICGEFDDRGLWHPCEAEIENTFTFPDITAGVALDARFFRVTPTLGIELFDGDCFLGYVCPAVGQIVFGNDLVMFGIGRRFTSVIEITAGAFGGWRLQRPDEQGGWTGGLLFTITRF